MRHASAADFPIVAENPREGIPSGQRRPVDVDSGVEAGGELGDLIPSVGQIGCHGARRELFGLQTTDDCAVGIKNHGRLRAVPLPDRLLNGFVVDAFRKDNEQPFRGSALEQTRTMFTPAVLESAAAAEDEKNVAVLICFSA
jgi:hypothetical protein